MAERAAKRITELMKVSKDCGYAQTGCFSNNSSLDVEENVLCENDVDDCLNYFYMVALASGESLAFFAMKDGLNIVVDIDGPNNGKNQSGNDKFHFKLNTDNSTLYPDYDCISNETCSYDEDFLGGYSTFVTKWVVKNDNLDYLKCPEELNWKTQTSCK